MSICALFRIINLHILQQIVCHQVATLCFGFRKVFQLNFLDRDFHSLLIELSFNYRHNVNYFFAFLYFFIDDGNQLSKHNEIVNISDTTINQNQLNINTQLLHYIQLALFFVYIFNVNLFQFLTAYIISHIFLLQHYYTIVICALIIIDIVIIFFSRFWFCSFPA